jgi:predicted transcriptional regulator
MTIRINKELQEKYNRLSEKTNRSRNELIGLALQYALDNMEIHDK